MRRYAAILIHAYSRETGKNLEEAILDLELERIVDPNDIRTLTETETQYLDGVLSGDGKVLSWKQAVN